MMISTRLLSFAVAAALLLPGTAACQRASTTVGLSLGVTDYHQRDVSLSSAAFRGAIASAEATFERRAGRTLLAFDGSYGEGHIGSDALPRDVRQHAGRFSLALLRAVRVSDLDGRGLTLLAGGGVSSLGSVTDVFARDAATGYAYWDWSYFWAHSLDLAGRAQLSGSRRSLALHVTASATRLVSRPNNGKDYNAENARVSESWPRSILRGSPEYAWNHPVVFARGEYRQRLGPRLQLQATWAFTFASTTRRQPIGVYANRLLLGLLRTL